MIAAYAAGVATPFVAFVAVVAVKRARDRTWNRVIRGPRPERAVVRHWNMTLLAIFHPLFFTKILWRVYVLREDFTPPPRRPAPTLRDLRMPEATA